MLPSTVCMGPSGLPLSPSQGQSRGRGRQGLAVGRLTALGQGQWTPLSALPLTPGESLVHHN